MSYLPAHTFDPTVCALVQQSKQVCNTPDTCRAMHHRPRWLCLRTVLSATGNRPIRVSVTVSAGSPITRDSSLCSCISATPSLHCTPAQKSYQRVQRMFADQFGLRRQKTPFARARGYRRSTPNRLASIQKCRLLSSKTSSRSR